MLTVKQIREDKAGVVRRLAVKGFDAGETVGAIEELDDKRKHLQTMLEALLKEQNDIAKEVGALFAQGKKDEAEGAKQRTAKLKEETKFLEEELKFYTERLQGELVKLPNLPSEMVPQGRTAEDNVVVRSWGETKTGGQPHWELAKKYDIIDFELGVKLTGAGFPVYKGQGAALQRALVTFFLDRNIAAGYTEVQPPILVNEASGFGTGQLPDKEGQMYHATEDNLYLIPTAEVPVTNIFRDTIVEKLPVALTAYATHARPSIV